jgi:hypothetical protein
MNNHMLQDEDDSEFDMQADGNNQFTERNHFSDRRHNPGTYRAAPDQQNQMQDDQYNIDDGSEDQDPEYMEDYGDRGQAQNYMQSDPRYRNGGYQQMQYSGGNHSNNYGRGQDRFGAGAGNHPNGSQNDTMGGQAPANGGRSNRNRFMKNKRY